MTEHKIIDNILKECCMKRLSFMKKIINFLFCICITISLVACGSDSGSPLKKTYEELYQLSPEYKFVIDNYFSFHDENVLKQEYPQLNITGGIMGRYKTKDNDSLLLVANMMKVFEEHLGGFNISVNEFYKANNGYYYGMLFSESGSTSYAILFETKDKNDMRTLNLKEKRK